MSMKRSQLKLAREQKALEEQRVIDDYDRLISRRSTTTLPVESEDSSAFWSSRAGRAAVAARALKKQQQLRASEAHQAAYIEHELIDDAADLSSNSDDGDSSGASDDEGEEEATSSAGNASASSGAEFTGLKNMETAWNALAQTIERREVERTRAAGADVAGIAPSKAAGAVTNATYLGGDKITLNATTANAAYFSVPAASKFATPAFENCTATVLVPRSKKAKLAV
jgi:hypothetical protein